MEVGSGMPQSRAGPTMGASVETLVQHVVDARERPFALVADLADEQLIGPRLSIVNPLLWEIGHVAWFQEHWVLGHGLGLPALRADGDALYDSSAIPHDTRWDLPLPSRAETLDYLRRVRAGVLDCLRNREPTPDLMYLALYTVFHEDMHDEAFLYTRQTLSYPAPASERVDSVVHGGPLTGDASVPGGRFLLGSGPGEAFVFDNEKWAHEVKVKPFRIARAPVTQWEFAAFVDDGGYRRAGLWTAAGDAWRTGRARSIPCTGGGSTAAGNAETSTPGPAGHGS